MGINRALHNHMLLRKLHPTAMHPLIMCPSHILSSMVLRRIFSKALHNIPRLLRRMAHLVTSHKEPLSIHRKEPLLLAMDLQPPAHTVAPHSLVLFSMARLNPSPTMHTRTLFSNTVPMVPKVLTQMARNQMFPIKTVLLCSLSMAMGPLARILAMSARAVRTATHPALLIMPSKLHLITRPNQFLRMALTTHLKASQKIKIKAKKKTNPGPSQMVETVLKMAMLIPLTATERTVRRMKVHH
jgi:hypothetical protein